MALRYDLAIIGAGSAGLTAARFAARLGKRVALIEANRVGGDCTWTGCIPSKALLHAAKVAHGVRTAREYGIDAGEPVIDFPAVMSRIRSVIDRIYSEESPDRLRSEGIDVIEARGEFRDGQTLTADGREIRAKRFLICTGAAPFIPPIPGLADTPYLTYESFWTLETLPSSLVIIGGGPIGCELAQACQRLGSRVTLVEALDRLLPNDEPEAGDAVGEGLAADGVELRLGTRIESADEIAKWGDSVLVAVGRRPVLTGLGLDAAGVAHTPAGITVDDYLRTTARNIYAAGDCIGGYQFTHYAGFQGAMAVRNALLPGKSRGRREFVPWATFTDPEAAHIGYTEQQASLRYGDRARVANWPMELIDRAATDGDTRGFIKVIHRPNGSVLGATAVGSRASELIQEWVIAVETGMKLRDLAGIMHGYPSIATGNQQLAWEAFVNGLTAGFKGRLLQWLSR